MILVLVGAVALAGVVLVVARTTGSGALRAVRFVVVAAVAGTLYVGLTFVQVWWASGRDDTTPSSAIVVLGAAQWNGRPSPVLRARLDHAADLYRRQVAPTVIVTGSKQEGDRVGEALAGYNYLRNAGVPEGALKIESTGTDTYEELSAARHILDAADLARDVVLVSSRYHAHRAAAIADEVGLRAHFSGVPTDESSLEELARETVASSAGRIISFRRLSNLQ